MDGKIQTDTGINTTLQRFVGLTLIFLLLLTVNYPVGAATIIVSPNVASLSPLLVGTAVSQVFTASGGKSPYTCSMLGSIPGLSFTSSTCTLSGTPTDVGTFTVTIRFVDADNEVGTSSGDIVVRANTTTTQAITSGHPAGTFMIGYPVWVVVQVNETAGGSFTPSGDVIVDSGSGGPSCTATLDASGAGECALVFDTTGVKVITSSYQGDTYFNASISSSTTITIQPLVVIPMLSAGRHHTCYLDNAGKIRCWGLDESYYDGTNGTNPGATFFFTKISSGGYHTCGLKIDGSIGCYGDNPDVINNIPTGRYVDISAGDDHVCAIDAQSRLHCWGNLAGDLVNVPTEKVIAVSAGVLHDCAIRKTNSRPICWGESSNNRLNAPNVAFRSLSVGNQHTCGIRTDGSLACWGNAALTPPSGTNFAQVGSGSDYSCARRVNGTSVCWGSAPPAVSTVYAYDDLSVGFLHACALLDKSSGDYSLDCYGRNTYGQAPAIVVDPASFNQYLPHNRAFSQIFTISGGYAPYQFTQVGGTLPAGLLLTDMTINGTPTTNGVYTFQLQANETYPGSGLPLELTPQIEQFTWTVEVATTATSITAAPTSAYAGMPVQVTVSVSNVGTPALTGFVQILSDEPEATCQAAISPSKTASCAIYFGSDGSHQFWASYGNDPYYASSTSTSRTITVTMPPIIPMVTGGNLFNCTQNANGMLTCWGKNDSGQASPPGVIFNQISAGNAHACGVKVNSFVSCWGWDAYGAATPPVESGYYLVSAGNQHTCGLKYDGTIRCWGNSNYAQTAVPSPGVGLIYQLMDSGANHACGVDSNGQPVCWGDNTYGQSTPPADILTRGALVDISAGGVFTCGLHQDGTLECWGGNGLVDLIRTEPTGTFKRVFSGHLHACGIRADDTLDCWGDNTYQQAIDPAGTYSSVGAGYDHTCALSLDGLTLTCWGSNVWGQAPVLGLQPTTLPVIDAGKLWNGIQFTSTGGRALTYQYANPGGGIPLGLNLDSNTGAFSGTPGQAGFYTFNISSRESGYNPSLSTSLVFTLTVRSMVAVNINTISPVEGMVGKPVEVAVQVSETPGSFMGVTPTGIVIITADDGKTCQANLAGGIGKCALFFESAGMKTLTAVYSGDGLFQAGDNSAAPAIMAVVPFSQVERLVSGYDRTYWHQKDGTLGCWGANCSLDKLPGIVTYVDVGDTLVCGLQTNGDAKCVENGQSAVVQTGPFTTVTVGRAHACATRVDGTVQCWGANNAGQSIPPAASFIKLSAAGDYTCGLRLDGAVACWGDAPAGAPAGSFEDISTGLQHACVLDISGAVICWGDNTYGQSSPVPAIPFIMVATGNAHSCGLTMTNEILCWGSNTNLESGPVYGLFDTLSTFADHSCALRQDTGLTCWGANQWGEAPQILFNPLPVTELVAMVYYEHEFAPTGGIKPYAVGVAAGDLPSGMNLGVDLSPAGVVFYGTPSVPDIYSFTLTWRDSSPLPLVRQQPYTIMVTGADLAVEILPTSSIGALINNEFTFRYMVTNHTKIAVPEALLMVDLPAQLANVQLQGITGCTLSGLHVECTLLNMPAGGSALLEVKGIVAALEGELLDTSTSIWTVDAKWPELNPIDNTAQTSVEAVYQYVYYLEPFDVALPPGVFSAGGMQTSPSGVKYLGEFTDSDSLRIYLDMLPPHQKVIITFDLFTIGQWMGNNAANPAQPHLWSFAETGQSALLTTTFCNDILCLQAYPDSYPGGANPGRSGSAGVDELGIVATLDTRYQMKFILQHQADVLDLTLASQNLPSDVRWGVDNFQVVLDSGVVRVFLPMLFSPLVP